MGDLGYNRQPGFTWLILLAALVYSLYHSRSLNLLTRGELSAKSLGVNTQHLQLTLYFLSSLLTACAVTLAGSIGFIGLIVPHIIRLLIGSDHRYLLPASVLLGGSLLCIADVLARTLLSPQQLPVGIITALLGVPIFLILLQRNNSSK